jgi:hypothetical protein
LSVRGADDAPVSSALGDAMKRFIELAAGKTRRLRIRARSTAPITRIA